MKLKKCIWIFVVLLIIANLMGCSENGTKSKPQENIGSKSTTNINLALIKKEIFDKDPYKELKAVELKTIPKYDNLVLALKIQEPNWFESLELLVVDEKGIKKTIDLDVGGDILAYRIIQIQGFSEPFFEVFDKSHMGGGDYSLFQIKDEQPILVYQTIAVDGGWEGFEWSNYKYKLRFLANINLKLEDKTSFVYRNGRLTSSYQDLDGDGFGDITLRGYMDFYHTWEEPDQEWYEDDKRELIATEPITEQIKYDKLLGKFVPWVYKRSIITNRESKAIKGESEFTERQETIDLGRTK